uniref:Uncharacterized protein n=1 Tax=Varanus komodoensis TaxID=61221 RepID=A0A8D2KWW0_VARKO
QEAERITMVSLLLFPTTAVLLLGEASGLDQSETRVQRRVMRSFGVATLANGSQLVRGPLASRPCPRLCWTIPKADHAESASDPGHWKQKNSSELGRLCAKPLRGLSSV